MSNINFENFLSQVKQKIENLNLKDKWGKFKLKLDQLPIPKWLLVIITSISVIVAIASFVSDSPNTNVSDSPNTNESEEETINGLLPGAEYLADIDGVRNVMTLYKDGSAVSSLSGDCEWHLESIKDQTFVVVDLLENTGTYYIDQNQNLYANSVNSKGYKMEQVNCISENDEGMVIGKRYTMPNFRWGEDAFITLNGDGTVSSEFQGQALNLPKWKKVVVDGIEWTIIYYNRFMTYVDYRTGQGIEKEKEESSGYIVSPSLEYYYTGSDDKNIKFLGGEVTFGDDWKTNLQGRLKE